MKWLNRPLSAAATLFAALLLATPLLAQRLPDPDAISWIPRVDTPPVIDGEIDQLWHAQPAFVIDYVQNGTVENAEDLSAVWYGLYDETNLYFLIDITDQFLESEAGSDIWRNDRIEVYFNMDNVKPGGNGHSGDNYQYAFHWNKPDEEFVSNGSWEGVEWTYTTTEYGYITEVAIPWDTLTNLDTSPGFSFGFDIAINDNDGFSTYDSVTYWWNSTGASEWGNIDGAGTVGLGDLFDGNYPPILAELDMPILADEGTESTFNLSATDANASDSLAFGSGDLPSFAQIVDNGDGTAQLVINATTGDANIYDFSVTVSDGDREDSMEVTLIVKDPNIATQVPEFAEVAEQSVGQANLLLVDVTVTDLDSLTVEIEATDLPEWASFTDNGDKTGVLALNPSFDVVPGSYSATLKATDPDQNADTLIIDIVVTETVKLTEFYVDPVNGDIQNDGSSENPWSTLEAVFDAGKLFAAGDVIYLRSGYHGEPAVTGANDGTVTIMPEDGASPTLSKLSVSSGSSNWHIVGLEISRSFAPEFTVSTMVSVSGSDNILEDCLIHSVPDITTWNQGDWLSKPSDGVSLSGTLNLMVNNTVMNTRFSVTLGGSFNTARGNHIQNFSGDGLRLLGNDLIAEYNYIADNYNVDDNHDDGIQSWSTGSNGVGSGVVYRVVIRGNTIIERTDPDRPFQGPLQGIGCFDGMFEDWIIENNVVVVNQWHGISLYGAINCKFINNTVIDQQPFASPGPTWLGVFAHKNYSSAPDSEKAYWQGRDNVVRNNLVTNRSLSASVIVDENNVSIMSADYETHFVDFPTDMRLKEGAPAIDAGSNTDAPMFDADGAARIVDGDGNGTATIDIGAYEFSGGADWRGWSAAPGDTADTGTFMGWVYYGEDPWVYSYSVGKYVYFSDSIQSGSAGGWVFFPTN